MVKKSNKKFGFSLAEVLVSMLIMSLFFLAFSKVITKKQATEFQKYPHGYYECYQLTPGGEIVQRSSDSLGNKSESKGKCNFVAPQSAQLYNIHYIESGSADGDGLYFNVVEAVFDDQLKLNNPQEFKSLFDDSYLSKIGSNEMGADMFFNYLAKSHKSSNIYKHMGTTGTRPNAALFIAW